MHGRFTTRPDRVLITGSWFPASCSSDLAAFWMDELPAVGVRLTESSSVSPLWSDKLLSSGDVVSGSEAVMAMRMSRLRTSCAHFWAGVSHVHVYACLRNAYRLTSHDQGSWRNRKALCTVLIDQRHAWIKWPIVCTYRPRSERGLS